MSAMPGVLSGGSDLGRVAGFYGDLAAEFESAASEAEQDGLDSIAEGYSDLSTQCAKIEVALRGIEQDLDTDEAADLLERLSEVDRSVHEARAAAGLLGRDAMQVDSGFDEDDSDGDDSDDGDGANDPDSDYDVAAIPDEDDGEPDDEDDDNDGTDD